MASASSENNVIQMSEYFNSLSGPSRERYQQKVVILGFDPYKLKKSDFSEDKSLLPSVDYPDIANYLVYRTSWATGEQMCNWKSMDSYNSFVSGWVNTLQFKPVATDRVLVYARVNHSQRARDTPLRSWFLAEKAGVVLAAHCDCMAGLDECCSHVGAMLWATWTSSRIHGARTCADVGNRWLLPAYVKDIPYLPVCEMDFTSARKKKELLLESEITPTTTRQMPPNRASNAATLDEQKGFYKNIAASESKPSILSLVAPYSDLFVPKAAKLPKTLSELLYHEANTSLDFNSLVSKYEGTNETIRITHEQCKAIEKNTIKQSKSPVWYKQRAGRITASKLKAACRTKLHKPSISLIRSICYPQSKQFSTTATSWGINKERKARDRYAEELCKDHEDFNASESGLFVYQKLPFLGASPDGLVYCKCCGSGVCEIKCPYRFRNVDPEAAVGSKDFCLMEESNSVIRLDRNHAYFYQVQAQISICGVDYCDFVVWTTKGIFVERILPDPQFWASTVENAQAFFKVGIFPELAARWYTQPTVAREVTNLSSDDDESGQWCYCQTYLEGSELVKCGLDECKVKWFHLKCVRLSKAPEGEWLCPDCSNRN